MLDKYRRRAPDQCGLGVPLEHYVVCTLRGLRVNCRGDPIEIELIQRIIETKKNYRWRISRPLRVRESRSLYPQWYKSALVSTHISHMWPLSGNGESVSPAVAARQQCPYQPTRDKNKQFQFTFISLWQAISTVNSFSITRINIRQKTRQNYNYSTTACLSLPTEFDKQQNHNTACHLRTRGPCIKWDSI